MSGMKLPEQSGNGRNSKQQNQPYKIMKTLFLTLFVSINSVLAADQIPNPLIDYKEFQKIVAVSASERESHRLTEPQFIQAMADKSAVLLDARTASKYELRHIRGAVSLPFTDFTADTLAKVIPTKDTKILIYCNNNFTGSPVSFASKMPSASLNISTYTSLRSYGYTNIFELGPLLNVRTTVIPFAGTELN
jgi:rhodanese-like protein